MSKLNMWLIVAVAVLTLAVVGLCAYNVNVQRSSNNWRHNYEVLQDSVEVVNTRNGELLYENGSLILQKKELYDALDLSKKQVRDYEKALGAKLAYISQLEARLEVKDTVTITNIIHDTLSHSYSMSFDDKWLKFNQDISFIDPENPVTKVYDIRMDVPLKIGIGDNYNIFITSTNPYFNAYSITGAVLDGSQFATKPSRWTLGAYMGFGLDYDLIHKTVGVGPQAGVGIGFRFF